MHSCTFESEFTKARENASGAFSIGETWALDELSQAHVFTGPDPMTEQERIMDGEDMRFG